jgi:hypothetical protein
MTTPTLLSGKTSMQTFGRQIRRGVVLTTLCLMILSNSGCTLTGGFIGVRPFRQFPCLLTPASCLKTSCGKMSGTIEFPCLILWTATFSASTRQAKIRSCEPFLMTDRAVSPSSRKHSSTMCESLLNRWWIVWMNVKCTRWSDLADCITVTTSARSTTIKRFEPTGQFRSLMWTSQKKWSTSTRTI